MTYRQGSFELVVYHASGGLRFHDNARWQIDDGESHVTFGDTAAVEMAQRYIEELAVAPLEECKLLRVTRLNVGVVERRTGVAEERVIDVGVAFQRMIVQHLFHSASTAASTADAALLVAPAAGEGG